MKIPVTILVVIMTFCGYQAEAQSTERVTGPKAKNVKSRDRLSHIQKTVVAKEDQTAGPKVKNCKSNERLSQVEKTETHQKKPLKGPKVKNKKHFRK